MKQSIVLRGAALVLAGALSLISRAAAQQCCTGSPTTYCTTSTTDNGCRPVMSAVGIPSATSGSGFHVVCTRVDGERYGTLLYGLGQPTNPPLWAPTSSSYVCVAAPTQRTGIQESSGTVNGCDGVFSLDFNAYMSTHPGAIGAPFAAGTTVRAQMWFRDPFAAKQSNLSNGIRFTLCGSGNTCQALPGFVAIPAGTFMRGSNAAPGTPYFGAANEQPVHQVTISQPFWLGRHEVTQAEYLSLVGVNPSTFTGDLNRPVEMVSWTEARAYCALLTAQQAGQIPVGYEYRLPTEAEWEYACRAGTITEYGAGTELTCASACFGYSYHSNASCSSTGTMPVGSFAPNAWGLYDMHGNVQEWCLDAEANYTAAGVTNPLGSGGLFKAVRGGGWLHNSNRCRSAFREFRSFGYLYDFVGFRVALAPIRNP